MQYTTVKDYGTDNFIIKKSQFIGYCKPVSTAEDAMSFIKEIKTKHKDATHNVWAYSLKEGNNMRYSDDGEPQGTAGIPVLEVLKKSDIVDAVVVVTRYFGGIMLGAGGLVRAYSQGASIGIAAAKPVCMKECIVASARCEYSYYNKLVEYLEKCHAVIDDTVYDDAVNVEFHILPSDLQDLVPLFADLTKGKGEIKEISKKFSDFSLE